MLREVRPRVVERRGVEDGRVGRVRARQQDGAVRHRHEMGVELRRTTLEGAVEQRERVRVGVVDLLGVVHDVSGRCVAEAGDDERAAIRQQHLGRVPAPLGSLGPRELGPGLRVGVEDDRHVQARPVLVLVVRVLISLCERAPDDEQAAVG
jgi:hypothetical protein